MSDWIQEGGVMAKVRSEISMSLDGFITGPNVGVGNELGDDGDRLHDWMFDAKTDADAEIVEEVYATTGAILIGRRMFDLGVEPWGDPPPFHMPVFVLTHEAREPLLIRQYLKAGLLDEMQIHLVPVLLGEGVRLFEDLGSERIELRRTRSIETASATHLRFDVVR
jgi:dihydrofolate reductase